MDFAPEALPDPRTGYFKLIGSEGGLWVPPTVEVKSLPPIRSARQYVLRDDFRHEEETAPCVVYPVPEHWQCEVTEKKSGRLYGLGYCEGAYGPLQRDIVLAWEREHWGPRVSSSGIVISGDMQKLGWQWKTDTQGMLRAFLALARDNPYDPQTIGAVRAFTRQWGPLWLCRNPTHFDCHWSPLGGEQYYSPCLWAPVEEIREVVRKAWQAYSVVEMAAAIRYQQPIPEKVRPYLPRATLFVNRFEEVDKDPNILRKALAWVLSLNLTGHQTGTWGPRLWVSWDQPEPQLQIWSGFGAISAIWLAIAQAVCDAHAFLRCDGCNKWYWREKRRPPKGRRNFCIPCREQGKTQLAWWHEHYGKAGQH